MRLADVVDGLDAAELPKAGERAHPELRTVRDIRETLQAAVVDDGFLADCIGYELDLIEATQFRRGLVPFHVIPGAGVRFAFGYWPPGGTPGPHEHTAWTITAVCRNELEVQTYDRDATVRSGRLVPKNRFSAETGRVGYIYEPSIHAPINTSDDWSLSLHVTSPRDGEPTCGEPIPGLSTRRRPVPRDHPYATAVATRGRTERVHVLARALAGMRSAAAVDLLDRCAALGAHATRGLSARARGTTAPATRTLLRTHPGLELSHRIADDAVSLLAETPGGTVEELTVDAVAAEAIAYVADEVAFDVLNLPGAITDDERIEIAEALEDSGLFTRTA